MPSVAIIDPDLNVSSSVEAAFTQVGFEAHVLGDGDVVEFIRQKTPDVILLNVELPRGSGYSFCNRLKKQADLKRIPIILTSGHETPEAFAQHQKSATHADHYMHKPFGVDQLLDAVHRLVPEAFPGGKPQIANEAIGGAPQTTPARGSSSPVAPIISAEGGPVMPDPLADAPAADLSAPPPRSGPPPRKKDGERSEIKPGRSGAMPSLDELIAQGRTEAPPQAPPGSAGPEAKLAFLRESLRAKEQDLARARELWASRDREVAQSTELLELRERELERARKRHEDLLAQLTATEDKVAALRLDIELGSERAERLEREKKALSDELENVTNELERNIMVLQQRSGELEDALRAEQQARVEENDRSATEIRDLVDDLERSRRDYATKEAQFNEADANSRSHIADLQGKIAGLEVELDNTKNKLADFTKDNEIFRRELSQLRADKASDDERARSIVEELEGRIRDLSIDKDGVEADLARTQSELAETQASLGASNARIIDLEADLADTQGRLSEVSSQAEQAETRSTELSHELAETQQHALELSQEKNRLEQKLGDTQKALAATEGRLGETLGELEETKQRATSVVRELEARIAAYKENITELEEKQREAGENYAQLENALRDVQLKLEEKHRDWDQERINRQKDVLKRDQRIGDLEAKNRELDQQVHETERAAKAREAELSHELDLSRARGDELDRDLNRARAKAQEMEALLAGAKERITEFARALKQHEMKVQQLTDELQVANERGDEMTRLFNETKERNAFIEAELNEERANRAQDVQARDAAIDRTSSQAKERIQKLQDALQQIKAEQSAAQAELQATRDRQQRAEERVRALEAHLEKEQRERQAALDRNSVLDGEVEGAQAKAEALTDELTRLKSALKRAQEEILAAKKDRAQLEERLKAEEQTMVKRVDEAKASAMEVRQSVQIDLERMTKERDEERSKHLDTRRKAEALYRKYKELEAQQASSGSSNEARVQKLADDLRAEKEARARETAQWKAQEERMRGELSSLQTQAASVNEIELTTLRAQVKERDDKLAKAQTEYTSLREKAQRAIAEAKAAAEKAKAAGGGDADSKAKLDQLTAKYTEAVQKLKQQVELNKKIDGAYKELADKHRKALAIIKEQREAGVGEATMIVKPTE